MKNIAIACAAALLSATAAAGDPYDYKELVAREVEPAKVAANAAGRSVIDFGKAAVGWLELDGAEAGPYEIVIGELVNSRGEVTNEYPGSSIRCQRLSGVKPAGRYRVPMPADPVNLDGYDPKAPAIRLPERFGIVFPFRYAEVVRGPEMAFRQFAVNYPIDMRKSRFSCDCADLVRVYDFCKYAILATSFCGVYVDGDRERTPYEADAYINQLSHYAIDDDYSLARKSHEWLMDHPTWPTEWKQHSIMMAWADWMWTGDTRSLAKCYDRLAGEKLLLRFARASDGLLETGGERYKGAQPGFGDIVDWPAAERDRFKFRPVNTVVNAFFYRNLREMADISRALGKDGKAAEFAAMAQNVYNAFQRTFFRPKAGLYADGEGTDHCSLHANAIALAFGLVPGERVAAVADFVEGKGLVCSVYFAQYLLEALFEAGRADAAIKLMSSRGSRSWVGMIDFSSTASMEAWNVAAKPNLDLTHAWSTAPLNIISRYVAGVTPLEPGFRKVAIRPQLGGLKRLSASVPTAAGPVTVKVEDGVLEYSSPVPAEVVFPGKVRELGGGTASLRGLTVGISDTCSTNGAIGVGSYVESVRRVGGTPVVVCRTDDPAGLDAVVSGLDLLVLTGGEDIAPARYGENPSPRLGRVNAVRDTYEWALLSAAVRHGVPIFGTCRGEQLLNVFFGGTLYQDLPSEFPFKTSEVHRSPKGWGEAKREHLHDILIEPGSRLASVCDGAARLPVNSSHHQAVKGLAPGFRVTARSPEGVVEAIECDWYPAAGVQFHPEALLACNDDPVWTRFYGRLSEFAGRRRPASRGSHPIGVFDSGIGGLSVLEKMLTLDSFDNETGEMKPDGVPDFRDERFVYFGDQANMPYGRYDAAGKADFLRELAVRDAQFVLGSQGHDPSKAVVIACNTATAYGLERVSAMARPGDAAVIGVVNAGVDGVLEAMRGETRPYAIGVMATPATISSGVYQRTLRASLAARGTSVPVEIAARGGIGLAEAVENSEPGMGECARTNIVALVEDYRARGGKAPIRAVVLGCTHYPFVLGEFRAALAELRKRPEFAALVAEDVVFVDPAVNTAIACYRSLRERGLLASRGAADGRCRVEAFISVGKAGPLADAVKYGRETGSCDIGTRTVPMTADNMPPGSSALIKAMMPASANAIKALNNSSSFADVFSPAYFWCWNARLDEAALCAQLEDMHAHGIRNVCIHPVPKNFRKDIYSEMEPDYLTPSYLEVYAKVVRRAGELGMHSYLYDEGGWPSGGACGLVAASDPEGRFAPRDAVIAQDGSAAVVKRESYGPRTAKHPSLVEKGAADRFIGITHEAYAKALGRCVGTTVRIAFTDEPDMPRDVKGSSLGWASDFADEFRRRKGYDVMPLVPDLIRDAAGTNAALAEVRVDVQDVKADLYVERYLSPIREWCHAHGVLSGGHFNNEDEPEAEAERGHGSLLRSLRAMDVPGVDVIWRQLFPASDVPATVNPFPRYAASAMHQNGGRLALSESFAVFGDSTSPAQMKWVVDYQMVRGINTFVFSSIGQRAGASEPHSGPVVPYWDFEPHFFRYVERTCRFLSRGRPGAEIAVLCNARGFWAGGADRKAAAAAHYAAARALDEMNCDYDFVEDVQLAGASVLPDGALQVGAMVYKAVVLPSANRMLASADSVLKAFEKAGGLVVRGVADIGTVPRTLRVSGCGARSIRVMKRIDGDRRIWFLMNEDIEARPVEISFPDGGAVVRYDPEGEGFELAAADGSVVRTFLPGETAIYVTGSVPAAKPPPRYEGRQRVVDSGWTLRALVSHEVGDAEFKVRRLDAAAVPTALGDWRAVLGRTFSGKVEYRVAFDADAAGECLLDLGDVKWCASARLNGKDLGERFFGPFVWPAEIRKGRNLLEVTVANLLVNQVGDDAIRGRLLRASRSGGTYEGRMRPFDRFNHESGLFGPVTLRMKTAGGEN